MCCRCGFLLWSSSQAAAGQTSQTRRKLRIIKELSSSWVNEFRLQRRGYPGNDLVNIPESLQLLGRIPRLGSVALLSSRNPRMARESEVDFEAGKASGDVEQFSASLSHRFSLCCCLLPWKQLTVVIDFISEYRMRTRPIFPPAVATLQNHQKGRKKERKKDTSSFCSSVDVLQNWSFLQRPIDVPSNASASPIYHILRPIAVLVSSRIADD